MRTVACAVSLLVLLSLGCTAPGGDDGIEYPENPDPTAAEVCGTQTAWPDRVRFVTAEHVTRRFRDETGWALQRFQSLDIEDARTVLELKRDANRSKAYEYFADFILDVVDPRCPALVRWLSAAGEQGPGGLVWENRAVWRGFCWTGAKRYPGSNLVVTWSAPSCARRAGEKWKRLDAVLKMVVGD